MSRRRDQGSALILTLGAVALLAVLVAVFTTFTRVERSASRNYRDGEKARFLAWAGVERAKYELRRGASSSDYPLPWMAYFPDMTTTPPQLEQAKLTTVTVAGVGPVQDGPSFRVDLTPAPASLTNPASTTPWPSGILGATYFTDPTNRQFGGDYYTLAVKDNNSCLFLNDGNPHLGKMIDALATAVNPAYASAGLGSKIVLARPNPGGYRRVEELRWVLTPSQFDDLSPFLTCNARVDRKVVEMGEQYTGGPSGTGSLRHSRLVIQPRAPININLAPYPVLVAVLNGIGCDGSPGVPATLVTFPQAQALATAIINYRRSPTIVTSADLQGDGGKNADPSLTGNPASPKAGFQKWAEFGRFLKGPTSGITDPRLQSAILANGNPNTDLNKFCPDLSIWRPVDKYDLTAATTEFCFGCGGIFTVESLGVILGGDGDPVAQAKVRSVVRIFERYVETTQQDFETDRYDYPWGVEYGVGTTSRNNALFGPGGYPGLRDMITLPEFRNAPNDVYPWNTANGWGTTSFTQASGFCMPQAEQAGLRAANYDGQVVFNVITLEYMSMDGAFSGYIGRDLTGMFCDSMTQLGMVPDPTGTDPLCRGIATTTPVASKTDPKDIAICDPNAQDAAKPAPVWESGSDLTSSGVFVGRKNPGVDPSERCLIFPQVDNSGATAGGQTPIPAAQGANRGVARTDHYDVPTVTLTQVFASTGFAFPPIPPKNVAVIPGFGKDYWNAATFELWYKPMIPNVTPGGTGTLTTKQILLEYETGKPHDVFLEDMQSATPDVQEAAQSIPNGVGNGNGDVLWGAKTRAKVWLELVAGTTPPQYTVKAEFMVDANYNTEHFPYQDPNSLSNARNTGGTFGFGGGSSPTNTGTHVPAVNFDCIFISPTNVRAGTWHHMVLCFHARQSYGGKSSGWVPGTTSFSWTPTGGFTMITTSASYLPGDYSSRHVQFYSDGIEVTTGTDAQGIALTDYTDEMGKSDGDWWPQNPDAQSQILANELWEQAYVLGTTHYDLIMHTPQLMFPENPVYQSTFPAEVIPASTPIYVGKGYKITDATTSLSGDWSNDHAFPFTGIIDNVVFDSKWQKKSDDSGVNFTSGAQERFDTWRPQLDPNGVGVLGQPRSTYWNTADYNQPVFKVDPVTMQDQEDPEHLAYKKHTPALEWDSPLLITSYEWTAWKDVPTPTDPNQYMDAGRV